MVIFFVFVIISVVIGKIWKIRDSYWTKDRVMILCVMVGMLLGVGASFLGGSFFVKKEVVAERYFISPMIFDGKTVVTLREEDVYSPLPESYKSYNYFFQIKEDYKTKLIKQHLKKRDVFFSLNEDEERYLEVKRSKTSRGNMWIWFFYGGTGIIESRAVLKKEDSFLILPMYYSL